MNDRMALPPPGCGSGAGTKSRLYAIVVPACFAILWLLLGATSVDMGREHDFLNLYTGASLALEGRFPELYDVDTQLRREQQIVPSTQELIPFVRPPFYALLISPLALLPFRTAFWVWLVFQVLLALVCIGWGCRRFGPDAVFFASMYAPLAMSIPHGQDALVMLAVLIASFALAERGRPAAGAVLSLGLIKFHLFVLWPVLLAVQKRWRMLGYLALGGGILVATSVLLSGTRGLLLYGDLLTRKDLAHLLPAPEKNANLIGVLLNFGLEPTALYGVLAVLTVCVAVAGVMRAPLWTLFAIATSGSMLVVPHTYGYDATMLLLPIWCGMFLSSRWLTRVVSATLCLPVVFLLMILEPPFTAAMGLAVLSFFLVCSAERLHAL
jgi:hypothetical protein